MPPYLGPGRTQFLSADEIVTEALHQFDEGSTAPSIRQLVAGLGVSPGAVYYHFPSQATIFQAVVGRVWSEAVGLFVAAVPDPFSAPPAEVLVRGALAIRQAFRGHHRVVPYLAASQVVEGPLELVIAVAEDVLGRLGFNRVQARDCFHTYASFVLGSIIFEGTRRIANEQLALAAGGGTDGNAEAHGGEVDDSLRNTLIEVMDVSMTDPELDEALFATGVQRIIESYIAEHAAG